MVQQRMRQFVKIGQHSQMLIGCTGGLVLAKSVGAGWSTSLKILNLNGNRLTTCSGLLFAVGCGF